MALREARADQVLVWNAATSVPCQLCLKPVFARDRWVMYHNPPNRVNVALLCAECFSDHYDPPRLRIED